MTAKAKTRKKKNVFSQSWAFMWHGGWWRRCLLIFFAISLLLTTTAWGIGQWYINKHKNEPLVIGTTFISDYAKSFGLDPNQTLTAILADLKIKRIRLVSYWKEIEPVPGTYDFSNLDWQFELAHQHNAKVSLAVGMRQPRWPECHEPKWAQTLPKKEWQPLLYNFMTAVIERYKNHPALAEYQLENEFFMEVFGECKDFDRDRLIEEYNLVKSPDPHHRVQISRSNNWVGVPIGKPTPDIFGIAVYKRVWDKSVTKRYYEYPFPPWFYAFLAGGGELATGKSMTIHELQTGPWAPMAVQEATLEEQFKSMNAQRMDSRIDYAVATGIRTIDLWGAEWWYWLTEKKNESSVWDVVKQKVSEANKTSPTNP